MLKEAILSIFDIWSKKEKKHFKQLVKFLTLQCQLFDTPTISLLLYFAQVMRDELADYVKTIPFLTCEVWQCIEIHAVVFQVLYL